MCQVFVLKYTRQIFAWSSWSRSHNSCIWPLDAANDTYCPAASHLSDCQVSTRDGKAQCRFRWPRYLRRGSAASLLLGLRVRIPLRAWMYVCCECCVLSGRGICSWPVPGPEEPYRVCVCVCVCHWVWTGDTVTLYNCIEVGRNRSHWEGKKRKNKSRFLSVHTLVITGWKNPTRCNSIQIFIYY